MLFFHTSRIILGIIIFNFLFSPYSVSLNVQNDDIPPDEPYIILLYPEYLENGSSYWPQDDIYFTLGGDLSRVEFGDYVVCYYWYNESKYLEGTLKNGVGIVHFWTYGEIIFDIWVNLTFEIFFMEGGYNNETFQEEMLLATHTFQFFIEPMVPWEPFGIVPVNFPNNSIVNDINAHNPETLIIFKAEGFDVDLEALSIGTTVSARELTFEHRWDDQEEWMNESVNTARLYGYDYIPFNYWGIYPYNFGDNGTHDLYIKLSNSTYEEIFNFRYTIIDTEMPKAYYIWNEDFFWRTGEIKPFLVGDTNYNVTFNWNDGTGNYTINSSNWKEAWGGWEGCYNLTVPNLGIDHVGYGSLTLWIDNAPRLEYAFSYETIFPEIELYYPFNDAPKRGMIPVVWSIQVCGRGRFNYEQYRFNIFYETDENETGLITENYNPLINTSYKDWDKDEISDYHMLKSKFLYDNTATDPMLVGYEFIIPDHISISETEEIRFIINETTTNTIVNNSLIKISQALESLNTDPDPIKPAISSWLTILPTPSSSKPSNFPFDPFIIIISVSIVGISVAIISFIWYWLKKKKKIHTKKPNFRDH